MTTFHDTAYLQSVRDLDYRTRRAPALDPDRDIVADGGRVRVPLALMDGVQQQLADRDPMREVLDHNRAAGERQLAAMQARAAEVEQHRRRFEQQDAERQRVIDADPRTKAYAESVADLDRRYAGGAQ